ncbi:MAG: ATP-dependent DNA helicase [archaeon]|nr:ATP-dependent DNA helicase [archaeon]
MRTAFCPGCSDLLLPGMSRCPNCGYSLDGDSVPSVRRSQPQVVSTVNLEAPYLPYKPRDMQLQIISDIRNALDQGKHIVIESGTGTGKTITSLAGALDHAKATGKTIIYTTRTISQSDQVMKELKAISTLKPVSGITLTGRGKSCPLLQERPDFDILSPNALSTLCSDHKQKSSQGKRGGCPYFEKIQDCMDNVETYCKKNFPTSEQLDIYCKNMQVCPYELKKALMKEFDVVVAPYIHLIDPDIRSNLFANLNNDEKGIVLIVDEAHNLLDAVREQESFSISTRIAASAFDECSMFKDAFVLDGVELKTFVKAVRTSMRDLGMKLLGFNVKEAIVPPGSLEESICTILKVPRTSMDIMIERTIELGEMREKASADDEAQNSMILELGRLMNLWVRSPSDRYVRIIRADEDGEFLHAACIDPVDIVRFMNSLSGAVHMSGTLQPLPQYAKVLGLPNDSIPKRYPSPFPKDNKLVIYSKTLTTNFKEMQANPRMKSDMQAMVAKLCNAVDKNVLVFFPSYRVMKDFRPYLEQTIRKNLYWEEAGKQKRTMESLNRFRAGRSGVFFCVMGGSIAEGMDFPGDELCFAVIVGIPYPPPSIENKSMSDLFNVRYGPGMGWKYTSEVPAVRKMRQAIGRLIRTETDRGMAVILDNRAARNARELEAIPSDDPVADTVRFFSNK